MDQYVKVYTKRKVDPNPISESQREATDTKQETENNAPQEEDQEQVQDEGEIPKDDQIQESTRSEYILDYDISEYVHVPDRFDMRKRSSNIEAEANSDGSSVRKWTNYSYIQGTSPISKGSQSKCRFAVNLSKQNYPESYLSVGISTPLEVGGRLPQSACMLSCIDGNFVSKRRLQNYLGSKVKPGSQIDILVDFSLGTLAFLVNGKYQGVALQSEHFLNGEFYLTVGISDFGDSVSIIQPQNAQLPDGRVFSEVQKQLNLNSDPEFDALVYQMDNYMTKLKSNKAESHLFLINLIQNRQLLVNLENQIKKDRQSQNLKVLKLEKKYKQNNISKCEVATQLGRAALNSCLASADNSETSIYEGLQVVQQELWQEIMMLHLADRRDRPDGNQGWCAIMRKKIQQFGPDENKAVQEIVQKVMDLDANEFQRLFPNHRQSPEFAESMIKEFMLQIKRAEEPKPIHGSLAWGRAPSTPIRSSSKQSRLAVRSGIHARSLSGVGRSAARQPAKGAPLRWDAQLVHNYLNSKLVRSGLGAIAGREVETARDPGPFEKQKNKNTDELRAANDQQEDQQMQEMDLDNIDVNSQFLPSLNQSLIGIKPTETDAQEIENDPSRSRKGQDNSTIYLSSL